MITIRYNVLQTNILSTKSKQCQYITTGITAYTYYDALLESGIHFVDTLQLSCSYDNRKHILWTPNSSDHTFLPSSFQFVIVPYIIKDCNNCLCIF